MYVLSFRITRNKVLFSPGKKTPKMFLDVLLEASENGFTLSDQEVQDEVEMFMFAVSEKSFEDLLSQYCTT
jgi:cytochrome P450